MTLILKLDLDMVMMYHHTKNEVSMSGHSKVIAQTDTQTDRHTHTHRQYENITFLHTRAVNMKLLCLILWLGEVCTDDANTDADAGCQRCRTMEHDGQSMAV